MYQLTKWLIPTLDRFPCRQKFLLGDRIQTTALTGLERLVEATFTRNRGRLSERVDVDLDKLRLLLRLSKEPGYVASAARGRNPPGSTTSTRRRQSTG